jgi:hypothetical protein
MGLAAPSMKDQMAELAAFQTKLRAVRAAPATEASDGKPPMIYPVALALLGLLRDSARVPVDWDMVVEFVRALPVECATQVAVREQLAFAVSQTGNIAQSIAEL